MEIIEIHHPYDPNEIPKDEVVMTLGFFDGVHRGHQEVIKRARKEADERQLKLAVMTFNQHPSIVFQKINPDTVKYLTTIEQKAQIMSDLGVDFLYVVEFTSAFAGLSPKDFVDEYIVGLHAKVAVAGFDYTYGKKEVASMEHLPGYANHRFDVISVDQLSENNLKISSSRIRVYLDEGKMSLVSEMLAYDYVTGGIVVHGDARGRTLGFPTANVKTASSVHLPKDGVYVVEIKVADTWYKGMAQIGHNITFEANRDRTVEVYILDFDQDIYGEQVEVKWHHYLRGEIKFDGIDGLVAQLNQDKQQTVLYFKEREGL
ncbi:riboflavin biosynthesis protein RibF [Vagococcus xieshaowenii]|uniref:Riboflavin biosynthesis protein n=1 Tax=Vagococcus xieshaowenii TaxID=2562451 RepID=A0AAJ5JLX1_9ENTE|nr:riboflavin biosynthesis protein RibF [Vagococcus xieshaowenii]QCA28774.1 riboflavin biosynthesis protein RibF [Vagococcus xieshaowenii]TFZ43025.1 riboflavin biosynthesis protein RibF [Vagococcus xieshaowenii]